MELQCPCGNRALRYRGSSSRAVVLTCDECGQDINLVAEEGFVIEGTESRTIRCACGNTFSADENFDNAEDWRFVDCDDIHGGVTEDVVLACERCDRKITLLAGPSYGRDWFQLDYLRRYGERFKWCPMGDKLEKVPYFGEP